MTKNDNQALINQLSESLEPASLFPSLPKVLLATLSFTFLSMLVFLFMNGDLRPGALDQLVRHPLFLFEFLFALSIGPIATYLAVKLMVPGEISDLQTRVYIPLFLVFLYIISLFSFYIYEYFLGHSLQGIEYSTLGKRHHCFFETISYSLLPIAFMFYFIRKGAVLRPVLVGFLVGLACAAPGAAMMQIACMYTPGHIFLTHICPVLIMASVGSFIMSLKKPI